MVFRKGKKTPGGWEPAHGATVGYRTMKLATVELKLKQEAQYENAVRAFVVWVAKGVTWKFTNRSSAPV